MTKGEDQIGLDLSLKTMPNTVMVNMPPEKQEDKNYTMILQMLCLFPESQNNSKKIYNSGSITGKTLINVRPFMKLVWKVLKAC